ncbi:MAG: hypothetical protein ACE5LS_05660 [Thermoplasmata archaeon]
MRTAAVPLFVLGLLALAALAGATHEADHRFHLHGSVVDSFGMPAMFVRVDVRDLTDPAVPPAAGTTGLNGGYDVILHLHSNNAGDQVRVTVGGQSVVITAQFDPDDPTTERFSPSLPFTIPPGANLVPYVLLGLAVVVPLFLVARRYAPVGRVRPRAKLGLDAISGIGRAREKELKSLGIDSLEKLAGTEPSVIAAKTSLTPKEAKRVVRRARALVEEREPPT